jgi:hypothetical protein
MATLRILPFDLLPIMVFGGPKACLQGRLVKIDSRRWIAQHAEVSVERRTFISGTALSVIGGSIFATALLRLRAASAQEAPGWAGSLIGVKNAEWIQATAAMAAPYVSVASGLVSIYGYFQTSKWQSATTDLLQRIESQIEALNQQVAAISDAISALPDQITQIVNKRHFDDLAEEIVGFQTLINAYISRPAGTPYSDSEKQRLADHADALLAIAGRFDAVVDDPQGYGASAYTLVSAATSAFLGAALAAQEKYDRSVINSGIKGRISYFYRAAAVLNNMALSYITVRNNNFNYVQDYPVLIMMGINVICNGDWETCGFPQYPDKRNLTIVPIGFDKKTILSNLAYLNLPRSQFSIYQDCSMTDQKLAELVQMTAVTGTVDNPDFFPLGGNLQPGFPMEAYGKASVRDRAYGIANSFEAARKTSSDAQKASDDTRSQYNAIMGMGGIIPSLDPWA